MTVQVNSESEILEEAFKILLQQMSPSSFARFWISWQAGQGDYLKWRDAEFAGENVETLYQEIIAFQERGQEQ